MKKIYVSLIFLLFLSSIILLNGCAKNREPLTKTDFYFDTVITLTLYDSSAEEQLEECFSLADKYEKLLSATVKGSDIWNINHGEGDPVKVSDETISLLEKAISYSELSHGAFDITIGSLSSLWDFKDRQNPQLPSQEDIDQALATVGYENIQIEGNTVTLKNPDTHIDLGGIAKGYIADQMKKYLNDNGIREGLINLGGNILTIGPKSSGETYKIGIQKPFDPTGTSIATVEIMDDSLVSSGVYERYFEVDGKRYHHILNPATGYPYENGLLGVTIITSSSADADALSTTCFALGLEDGMELIEQTKGVEAIFITEDNQIHKSSGIGTDIPFKKTAD